MEQLCNALIILFWKLPQVIEGGTNEENAEWWVAELRDKNICVEWDKVEECFQPTKDGAK